MARDRVGSAGPTRVGGGHIGASNENAGRDELRANLNRRLDDLVTRAADSFQNVIKASEVGGRAESARGALTIEVEATNLVSTCEALLRLTSELKVASIAQDVQSGSKERAQLREKQDRDATEAVEGWTQLRNKVQGTLKELETHYYHSIAHFPHTSEKTP